MCSDLLISLHDIAYLLDYYECDIGQNLQHK